MSAGPTGIQGLQGVQGSQGATGATGLQGNPGAQGGQGSVGPPGATGPAGSVASFAYYSISSFNQSIIANAVSILNTSPVYISQMPLPSAVKGRSGQLSVFFNLSTTAGFAANSYFDYGLYVDGTALGIGDTTTIRYVQTAQNSCAISWDGYSLGTNSMMPYSPLTVPVSFAAGASNLQIGIKNSSAALNVVASYAPSATVSTTVTTTGSNVYTVPATAGGFGVVGVYCYLWGCGGGVYGSSSGGGGGFVSGFYSCSAGTNINYVVGATSGDGGGNVNLVSVGGAGWPQLGGRGGGFSGLFLSNAGGFVQSNAIAIAGGGGGGGYDSRSSGGAGGYPTGDAVYNAGLGYATDVTGGTQTAGGGKSSGAGTTVGSALQGGLSVNGGGGSGGGWYGGGGAGNGTTSGNNLNYSGGGGGSSYVGNILGASPSPAGLGLTGAAVASNGTTITTNGASGTGAFPGGRLSPYYVAGRGVGTSGTGLVVFVPAIGTAPVYVGAQAAIVC